MHSNPIYMTTSRRIIYFPAPRAGLLFSGKAVGSGFLNLRSRAVISTDLFLSRPFVVTHQMHLRSAAAPATPEIELPFKPIKFHVAPEHDLANLSPDAREAISDAYDEYKAAFVADEAVRKADRERTLRWRERERRDLKRLDKAWGDGTGRCIPDDLPPFWLEDIEFKQMYLAAAIGPIVTVDENIHAPRTWRDEVADPDSDDESIDSDIDMDGHLASDVAGCAEERAEVVALKKAGTLAEDLDDTVRRRIGLAAAYRHACRVARGEPVDEVDEVHFGETNVSGRFISQVERD
jgi:hypothetical protein